jgi:hypothetical protein
LGHNFVLADARCNNNKRDRLPAYEHLSGWVERNAIFGEQIRVALEEHGIMIEVAASNRIAEWAYGQTEAARGLTWLRADEMCLSRFFANTPESGVAATSRDADSAEPILCGKGCCRQKSVGC